MCFLVASLFCAPTVTQPWFNTLSLSLVKRMKLSLPYNEIDTPSKLSPNRFQSHKANPVIKANAFVILFLW